MRPSAHKYRARPTWVHRDTAQLVEATEVYALAAEQGGSLARFTDDAGFVRCASQGEAYRYRELLLLERARQIRHLETQPRFPLVVLSPIGELVTVGTYVADFRYTDAHGEVVIEDFKGFRTEAYRLKKKHVEAQYGITIREVVARSSRRTRHTLGASDV